LGGLIFHWGPGASDGPDVRQQVTPAVLGSDDRPWSADALAWSAGRHMSVGNTRQNRLKVVINAVNILHFPRGISFNPRRCCPVPLYAIWLVSFPAWDAKNESP
jgi:hypothetical protein